ncbi:MAG: oligopeptidase A [Candidatus Dasytiphilus stammeri]
MSNNPLLRSFKFPPFSRIKPEHIVPAIQTYIDKYKRIIDQIISNRASSYYNWKNFCQPLEELSSNLNRIFSPIRHLNSVQNDIEFRKHYEKCISLISDFNTWIGQHKKLYDGWCEIKQSSHYDSFNQAQKKTVDNTLRDYVLSGIRLSPNNKSRYREIVRRLSKLSCQYSNNVLDATNYWKKLVTNKNELSGIPESILSSLLNKAKSKNLEGWLLTLDTPSYSSIITYCDNQLIRQELYYAYNTRASDVGPNFGKWDNTEVIEEELNLRYELAQLLSFNSYADLSLANKMAESPTQVISFLNQLLHKIRPQAEKELMQLKEFAKKHYNTYELHPWDIAYYSEKQKQHLYNLNDEDFRSYFPIRYVLKGMFDIVKRIYGIKIKKRYKVDVWDSEVQVFEVLNENNQLYGSLYFDLYNRENKTSGAWMDVCTDRMRKSNDRLQNPIAFLTTNFRRPLNQQKSALLSHHEVITLFHEFGHALHHILTRIDVLAVSGINGVPWDAVEFPSQFMENWCWERESLLLICKHYKNRHTIPKKLLDNLLLSKNYQIALFLIRQLELSLFDFYLHAEFSPKETAKKQILKIRKKLQSISVIPIPEWNRFSHSFHHIFANGYAAGYYSYLWAKVLAADAYSLFLEKGIFNSELGQSFLDNILSQGGSEDPMILFKRFRGREPLIDTILKSYDINN